MHRAVFFHSGGGRRSRSRSPRRDSGGGGYGDPLKRKPEQVHDDVLDGLISRETAQRDYGVVIGEDLGLDLKATESERSARS